MGDVSRVLVVDDSTTARRKLSLAVKALGHDVEEVASGAEALEILRAKGFDLVLLDILMPDIDGFEVLKQIKQDEALREIPVLVVSGLENEPGAVIEAIRLGAIDFLPKAFEPVLLEARVTAALRRKRNRDKELAEIMRINRLVGAAELLETSLVDSEHLGVSDLAERKDELGAFAGTFSRLAESMYLSERDKRRRLATRRGLLLLVASGTLFGMSSPLSRIASTDTPHAIGLALWVNLITAIVCLSVTMWRGKWPAFSADVVRVSLLWGVIGAVLTDLLLFAVARHVPASTLSIVIVLESFFVFGLAAAIGFERATPKRLVGLLVGLIGIVVVMQPGGSGAGVLNIWVLGGVLLALMYAVENLLLARYMPPELDLVAGVGLASAVGVVFMLPFVISLDAFVAPSEVRATTMLAVTGIAFGSMIGTTLQALLIRRSGPVFTGQISYVITFSGVLWSMLLIGERLAPSMWLALGILVVGMLLVEPKRDPDSVLDIGVFGAADPKRSRA